MRLLSAFVGVMLACATADASFLDDETELSQAIPALRSSIGNHPRVLKIEVDPNVVAIEAQDSNNLKVCQPVAVCGSRPGVHSDAMGDWT
jgi:hypothetical protein